MKKQPKLLLRPIPMLMVVSSLFSNVTHAWLDEGHEAVQVTAVRVLQETKHPLAKMFALNLAQLRVAAIAPEKEWKDASSTAKEPAVLSQATHFFAVDAFVSPRSSSDAVARLPMRAFEIARAELQELAKKNRETLAAVDLAGRPVEQFGIAPWRAYQLYEELVAALKERNWARALVMAGALSHFVADVHEPLRTTLNFNGDFSALPSSGAFAAFEDKLIDFLLTEKAENSLAERIYLAAMLELGGKGIDGLSPQRILQELAKAAQTGFPFVGAILGAYAEECRKSKIANACEAGVKEPLPASHLLSFYRARVPAQPEQGILEETTPERILISRLAVAAVLTARIWATAYETAGKPVATPVAIQTAQSQLKKMYVPIQGIRGLKQ